MNDDRPLSAMVSYQSKDLDESELLHEELALRGFVVVHDQCSFLSGSRIATEMELGVQTCDAFVSLLTPHSLYLGAQPGSPRPALDGEFIPAMERRRQAASSDTRRPIVVLPVPKRLGSRADATEKVFGQTGEDVGSIWIKSVETDDPVLGSSEAARIAQEALKATLSSGVRVAPDQVDIVFVSRGRGQPPAFLTIDATSLVGGCRRAGSPEDWTRILRGLSDVEGALANSSSRELHIRAKAHISGAIAMGRVFNQLGGWRLSVAGRHGPVRPSPAQPGELLEVSTDPQGRGRDLSCEISLVGQPVFDMAREAIRSHSLGLAERVRLSTSVLGDIDCETASRMASEAAFALRERVAARRPPRTHVFCASPADVAVLIGYRLTALGTDLHLYEREGDGYHLALVVPADHP